MRGVRAGCLLLALLVAVPATGVRPAAAATAGATTELGALRVAVYLVKRYGPYVLALVSELLDRLPDGDAPPPPPPPPPDDPPPFPDPALAP